MKLSDGNVNFYQTQFPWQQKTYAFECFDGSFAYLVARFSFHRTDGLVCVERSVVDEDGQRLDILDMHHYDQEAIMNHLFKMCENHCRNYHDIAEAASTLKLA